MNRKTTFSSAMRSGAVGHRVGKDSKRRRSVPW